MRSREPWLGIAGAFGLVIMLIGDGGIDILGLAIVVLPLVYGLRAAFVHRHQP